MPISLLFILLTYIVPGISCAHFKGQFLAALLLEQIGCSYTSFDPLQQSEGEYRILLTMVGVGCMNVGKHILSSQYISCIVLYLVTTSQVCISHKITQYCHIFSIIFFVSEQDLHWQLLFSKQGQMCVPPVQILEGHGEH